MNPCQCRQPKSQPPGDEYLGLPQQTVIRVDAAVAQEIRAAMAHVKIEGLTVGGLGGAVGGLVLGMLLAALAGRRRG